MRGGGLVLTRAQVFRESPDHHPLSPLPLWTPRSTRGYTDGEALKGSYAARNGKWSLDEFCHCGLSNFLFFPREVSSGASEPDTFQLTFPLANS